MKRVIIVGEGTWGQATPGDYKDLVELFRDSLGGAVDSYSIPGSDQAENEKIFRVEVVATAVEAEQIIKSAALNQPIEKVIFVSRGMELIAERLAATYPQIRVIIFSGLVPEGKIVWVNKSVIHDSNTLKDIVRYS